MKKIEELSYYSWLEDVVRSRNKNFFTDPYTDKERNRQSMLIVNYIEKKYSNMFDKLMSVTIDASSNKNISQKDIFEFLGKSEKGTAVTWKDKNGNEFLFVNTGSSSKKNKKRILVFDDEVSKKNKEFLRRALVQEILRKDIEHISKKIKQKEIRKRRSRLYFSELFSQKNSISNNASSFESNFKKMIKKQGYGASSMFTAQVMVRSMSASEKKKLQKTFYALGVKSGEDLELLLNKWKNQALSENVQVKRQRKRSVDLGIGM